MSHHIEIINGKASFITRKAAWHGLSKPFERYLTFDEALTDGGLNYPIEKQDTYVKRLIEVPGLTNIPGVAVPPVFEETFEPSGHKAIVRTDTGHVLGHVSKSYSFIENSDAFSFFAPIIDRQEAFIESAGVLFNGEIAFVCTKLPEYIEMPGGDITKLFVVLINTFNGKMSTQAIVTPTRVVCWNTLNLALGTLKDRVTVRHTGDMKRKMEQAHRVLGLSSTLRQEVESVWKDMRKVYVSDGMAKELLTKYFVDEKRLEEAAFGTSDFDASLLGTRYTNRINGAYRWYQEGPGAQAGNAYGLLQGITGYISHEKNYRTADHRMKSLVLDGNHLKRANDLVLSLV